MLDKSPSANPVNVPNDLAAHWMPFTANRAFKKQPRLLAGAKDMHYITVDGRKIIDAASGMWCTNAGHGRTQISDAIAKQAATLDYAPPLSQTPTATSVGSLQPKSAAKSGISSPGPCLYACLTAASASMNGLCPRS